MSENESSLLDNLLCPCDPTGTGCHAATCPIGRAEAAEHLLENSNRRTAMLLAYLESEAERARQLETANPIATRDVLERVLKYWKNLI
jgi:hypothetical protein